MECGAVAFGDGPNPRAVAATGGAPWRGGDGLDGAFSAGDLMMVSVLLRSRASGLLDEFPTLAAYVARGARDLPTAGPLPIS